MKRFATRRRSPPPCCRWICWRSTLLYGALFGFFRYATFELTSLSPLKHWTWPVGVVDIAWGTFVTATASTLGLVIANWLTPRGWR